MELVDFSGFTQLKNNDIAANEGWFKTNLRRVPEEKGFMIGSVLKLRESSIRSRGADFFNYLQVNLTQSNGDPGKMQMKDLRINWPVWIRKWRTNRWFYAKLHSEQSVYHMERKDRNILYKQTAMPLSFFPFLFFSPSGLLSSFLFFFFFPFWFARVARLNENTL